MTQNVLELPKLTNENEAPVRLTNMSLYDEGIYSQAIIAYSRRPENASVLMPKACGIIQTSKVSKKSSVHSSTGRVVIVTQEGPWASPNIDVSCEDVMSEDTFSLYVNNRRTCLKITEQPLEGRVTLRGPDGVKGHLQLVQEAFNGPVHIIGNVVGLSEGQHGFHIHEFGSTGNNCQEAGSYFNPFGRQNGGREDSERHRGDLGNIYVGANDTSFIEFVDDAIDLFGPHSVIGRTIVIHQAPDDLGEGNNADSSVNAGGRVACGHIQTEEDYEKLVVAEAVIEGERLYGKIDLSQQGPGDFVHVEGSLVGFSSAAGDYELSIGSKDEKDEPLLLANAEDMIFEDDMMAHIDTIATNGLTLMPGQHSLIGQDIVVRNDTGQIVGNGVIKKKPSPNPKRCQLPAVMPGKSCPLSDFAWSFDVTLGRCRSVNSGGCPYATENQFATQSDCKRTCPEVIDLEIRLLPTAKVLGDFIVQAKLPITEEMKRRFQLCHTIQLGQSELSDRQTTMKTVCGENVNLQRQTHGFLLNGEPVLSIAKCNKVIVLVDFVLGEPWDL
jgi:Cu-Zn family superoxide dismutase